MNRIAPACLVAGALVCACSTSNETKAPSSEDVDRLERSVAGRSCIGPLEHWQRHYWFPMGRDRRIDDRRIAFTYKEAGAYGFRARRIIENRSADSLIFDMDHRQYRVASGTFEATSGRVTIGHRGWNCDENVPAGGTCG